MEEGCGERTPFLSEKDVEAGEAEASQEQISENIITPRGVRCVLDDTENNTSRQHEAPSYLQSLSLALVPSFLQPSEHEVGARCDRSATAHLDGLRGLACFVVYIHHTTYVEWHTDEGWGEGDDPTLNREIYRLPFVNLLQQGAPMVSVFFVISGYVLSVRPLDITTQMRKGNAVGGSAKLLQCLSSSLFKRWFRLFLPCMAITLLVAILLQLSVYEITRPMATDYVSLYGDWEEHPEPEETILSELYRWSAAMVTFTQSYGDGTGYNPHLWTIPLEFQSSLRLYLTLLLISPMNSKIRNITILILILWAIVWDRYELLCFWGGLQMAVWMPTKNTDDYVEQDEENSARESRWQHFVPRGLSEILASREENAHRQFKQCFNKARPTLLSVMFVIGLYCMSTPSQYFEITPGYVTLAEYFTPPG